ncbi:EAL domain-containing protein [Methylonatrum kenyense]|uniref:bifunctional diguanylate cyclase/phosphodiesterase n=1 Tax=Methylonatrum kenyense TaxID=455253 RepID=UPI0020BF526B|nr:EAL domain-containing protein [Methylonatrum kenyense]MCK8515046.1 EAL domain-containing protein [Methylonatrum kenyense]
MDQDPRLPPTFPLRRLFRGRVLSLKWRAIALTSLLLLGMAGLFAFISHQNLTTQFDQTRDLMHERQLRELARTLEQSADDLRRLADMAVSAAEIGGPLYQGDAEHVQQGFESHWPMMQLDAGVDEVRILTSDGEELAAWGQPLGRPDDAPFAGWAQSVAAGDMPVTSLLCVDDCRQYVAVPVLAEGSVVGAIVMSRSLADVARHVQQVSGSDVSLLVAGDNRRTEEDSGRYLADWDATVRLATRQSETLPVLEAAASRVDSEELADSRLQLEFEGRHVELAALPLGDNPIAGNPAYMVLVSDITEEVNAIRSDTRTILLVGLFGWLAAESLLLGILWMPMARLRRLADVLPVLARGGFHQVRETIGAPVEGLQDEIDVLDRSAIDLANQLEGLEGSLRASSTELAARVRELARERDFVNSLLDTARVIIVTQNRSGRISLVNQHAGEMTGIAGSRLLGRSFIETFLPQQADRPETNGRRPPQEEGVMTDAGGEQRTIAWYHAPISRQDEEDGALISVGLDITDRKRAEDRLAWLANRDPLTDLYNRRYFQTRLQQVLADGGHGAMLFMDLDQFRDVNELSGHHSGDQLLRLVAERLDEELGGEGLVARLGGDEFAVLLQNASAEEAESVAARIARVLEGINFSAGGRRHRAVASIGIALYPRHGTDPADLMASADLAMYKAKETGAECWHLLSTSTGPREELSRRVYWIDRIRDAQKNDRFELMGQPIVQITDGSTSHYEMLVRMHGEDGNLVPPSAFVPVAERSGQIVDLDRWVLRASLRLLRDLQEDGLKVSVNLSAQSLRDTRLPAFLEAEFNASGADPSRLVLEVTETAAVTDFATARGLMEVIRDLGCHFALDDFGVGFSSFHYLGQLPAEYIKIDGSFIRNLPHSVENRLIVRAIADIAAGFGKKTVAEFVDDEGILPFLREYGVDYAQGYHLGRPLPVKEIMAGRG